MCMERKHPMENTNRRNMMSTHLQLQWWPSTSNYMAAQSTRLCYCWHMTLKDPILGQELTSRTVSDLQDSTRGQRCQQSHNNQAKAYTIDRLVYSTDTIAKTTNIHRNLSVAIGTRFKRHQNLFQLILWFLWQRPGYYNQNLIPRGLQGQVCWSEHHYLCRCMW